MDPIREGIVRFADKASGLVQNTFQIFGFLPDGRELVDVSDTEGGLMAAFSDRSDEGWGGFHVHLPAGVVFSHATIGFLSRKAFWAVRLPAKAVVDHLSGNNGEFPKPKRTGESRWSFWPDPQLEISVAGTRKGITMIWVTQTREPVSIEDAIKARSSEFQKRWGHAETEQ